MATILKPNFYFQDPECKSGDVFEGCNLSQVAPGTAICAGKTKLKFNFCNLINAIPPSDAKVVGCNTAQIEFCSHRCPNMVRYGLPVCEEDCAHRKSDTKVWVPITEKEYRASYRDLSQDNLAIRVAKTVDEQGVTVQEFEKEVFEYDNHIVGKYKPTEVK